MRLGRLIFTSRSTQPLSEDKLDNLAAALAARNETLCLTGMLLHDGYGFLQVLEGDLSTLQELYHKVIVKDPRHTNVQILDCSPIDRRTFSMWWMNLVDARRFDDSPVWAPEACQGRENFERYDAETALQVLLYASMATMAQAQVPTHAYAR